MSLSNSNGATEVLVAPAGEDFKVTVTSTESPLPPPTFVAVDRNLTLTEPAVELSETAVVAFPADGVSETSAAAIAARADGTELNKLNTNEATAITVARLKYVLLDIYFLSLVVTRNFLVTASR